MKTVITIVTAAQLRWRRSLLCSLVERVKDAIEKAKAKEKAREPEPTEDIFVVVGATKQYIIPAIYWKLALVARVFSAKSLFSLCEILCDLSAARQVRRMVQIGWIGWA